MSKTKAPIMILFWLLLFALFVVIVFTGCGGHHYVSSTDHKTDNGKDWWPKYIEGVGFCECYVDKKTDVTHCVLIR